MHTLICLASALALAAAPCAAQDSTAKARQDSLVKAAAAKPAAAQDSAKKVDIPKGDSAAKSAQPASASSVHSLSRFVLYPNGRPVRGATVLLVPAGENRGRPARGALTDTLGRFTLDSVPADSYDLRVLHQKGAAPVTRRIYVSGSSVGDVLMVPLRESRWWALLVLGALILYALSIMMARWHNIAQPLEEILKGQLSALDARLNLEVDQNVEGSVKKSLRDAIQRIQDDFRLGSAKPGPEVQSSGNPDPANPAVNAQVNAQLNGRTARQGFPWYEFLCWSRGRENAAWTAIHEVERQMVAHLTPPERVASYLQLAHAQLRVLNTPPAVALADAIQPWLPTQSNEPTTPAQDLQRRALLGRAIALANEERDKQFSSLMEWHNKASWLILACILMIFLITLAAGHAILFLAGAAGGFLSRLMRAIRREAMPLPLDYGASWTTLFLSPLLGALVAWFGIALITLATQPNVNLLGDAFRLVDWNDPTAPTTLAIAFVLGFSERLFDAIVGAVERRAAGTRAADEAAKAMGAGAASTPAGSAKGESSTTSGNGTRPAAPGQGGPTIDLENGPLPVGVVVGKVVLEKPATAITGVDLSTNRPDFVVTPAKLSIPAGQREGEFEIVPKGNAPAGSVRVTAQVGTAQVNDTIEFV